MKRLTQEGTNTVQICAKKKRNAVNLYVEAAGSHFVRTSMRKTEVANFVVENVFQKKGTRFMKSGIN